ncbi:GNAT family N-acetyltransferase [Clostridium sp. AL.422]|uniref:GNAT family N-acetyltransferase n=1 Tax=Clostridium TaxID=1485 RepID=UPI00293DB0F1|nr:MULTISPECIES: GNAT family N-acetyltransferase [unclassified Clostridium]MDV4152353.1 GNAT family N-acetyltransferase [Clostridium sp. AL.422]
MKDNYEFRCKYFDQLNISEFYEIVKSRYEVFACEQEITCENDFDDKDRECMHLFAIDNKEDKERVVGYCRLLPPGLSYSEASIGRVLVLKEYRGKGIAKEMMLKAIEEIQKNFKVNSITLSAQSYIKNLYICVGFIEASEEYEEAGIPHVKMKFRI